LVCQLRQASADDCLPQASKGSEPMLLQLALFREARRAFGRPKDCDGVAVQSRKSSRPMLPALAIDHRPPVSIARRSNGVRSFFPFGPSSNGGICRRRRVQIVFGRLKAPLPANPKTDETRHHQPGSGYHHPMRIHHLGEYVISASPSAPSSTKPRIPCGRVCGSGCMAAPHAATAPLLVGFFAVGGVSQFGGS
jgi:hypothetical protein